MDKEFLKKYNLSESVKRFQQINEYTFYKDNTITEEGDDDQQDNNGQEDPMNGGMGNPDGMGAQPPAPDMSQGGDMETPPMDGGMDAGANAMGGQEQPPMDNGTDIDGGNAMPMDNGIGDDGGMGDMPPMDGPDMGDDEMEIDVEEDGEGDTVIDVDDLTQSQEAAEIKIDGVDDKMTELLKVLTTFGKALNANDKKIDDLRKEIENRIPSQQEKLNIRSQASYPYSETPKKYWEDKTLSDPRYGIVHDNEVAPADEIKKFEITRDDVKNINPREIADSFDLKNLSIDKFLNF